nr:MAG TPA: type I restriction modification DNA specificity domain protein [Bacteriophage sp.]
MIDTKGWGEFRISDIFVTNKHGKVLKVPTGAAVSKDKLKDGNIPRVTVSNFNNGITGHYADSDDKDYRVYNNFISVSFLGTVFYQPSVTSLDMKVHCLKPLEYVLNEYSAGYIVSVIRKTIMNFAYSDQLSSEVLAKLRISLPITIDGQPDWAYMESYMKKIIEESEKSLENLKKSNCNNRLIDTRSWKNYILGNLFELVNSKAYHDKDVVEVKDENGLLYVTRSKFNNGIKCKVEKKSEYIINPAGTISFGAENADFFYQKKEYITGNKMYYINTCNISELAALFLKSVLEATFTKKFSFSNGMVPNRIRNEIISLPAMPDGQPDWAYMESYMKKIIEESEQAISALRAVV